ncbi:MAG: hypothetical protein WCC36_03825 [Gammaproteobacteria bacterium]
MGRTLRVVLICVAAAGALGGCYRSPDVQVHKPGVYQGARDPLLAVEKTEKQQKRLEERFQLVQTDR